MFHNVANAMNYDAETRRIGALRPIIISARNLRSNRNVTFATSTVANRGVSTVPDAPPQVRGCDVVRHDIIPVVQRHRRVHRNKPITAIRDSSPLRGGSLGRGQH